MAIVWLSTQWRTSKMSEKSSISRPSGDDAAPNRAQVFSGPYIRARPCGGFG